MAVLAHNMKLSFELDPRKADDFFKKSDKTAFERLMKRAASHKMNREKKEDFLTKIL